MKKNFLTVAAMAAVAFFVSAEIAKAADITFSGQVRTRWELAEHLGNGGVAGAGDSLGKACLLYTSPSPRDKRQSRMPSSA